FTAVCVGDFRKFHVGLHATPLDRPPVRLVKSLGRESQRAPVTGLLRGGDLGQVDVRLHGALAKGRAGSHYDGAAMVFHRAGKYFAGGSTVRGDENDQGTAIEWLGFFHRVLFDFSIRSATE